MYMAKKYSAGGNVSRTASSRRKNKTAPDWQRGTVQTHSAVYLENKTSLRKNLNFIGTWRSYQARVLENSRKYLEDGRVHIVAAPGSGKTTLGIELIARADVPCLVLAPSITIREQWLSRMKEGFGASEDILSNDIREPKAVTAITYQALHSCIKRLKAVEEDEEGNREETDYTSFDFFETIQKAQIGTLCLDEAHHLRSEWQKALEEVAEKLQDVSVIALTATPPYDSTPAQWERYISLCGPIDEEISVPELVKEGSLCPHQDYVYFNIPTPDEIKQIRKFRKEAEGMYQQLLEDEQLCQAICSHVGLKDLQQCAEVFAQNREYLKALLSYLKKKEIAIPDELRKLASGAFIPGMNKQQLALLLQGFLFDDVQHYTCDPDYQNQLVARLRVRGLIHRGNVELASSSEVDKLLINSRGKLLSMEAIVRSECQNLGENLRLLILTDYIRGEFLAAVGDPELSVEEMGVVPIFEFIRRKLTEDSAGKEVCEQTGVKEKNIFDADDLRLAALSGSVVILPEAAKDAFVKLADQNGQKAVLKPCKAAGYYQADLSGSGPRVTVYLTELFNRGLIRVLVGTKSLLGEGWDAPCINSLILASFVGSFMLSNQMRGRAIRTMRGVPDKVSNIWHLICMEPVADKKENAERISVSEEEVSADFATLRRRFDGFLGIHYEEERIENGLARLSCIQPPYDSIHLEQINQEMTARAADRIGVKKRWESTLAAMEKMETVEGASTSYENLQAKSLLKESRKKGMIAGLGTAAAAAAGAALCVFGSPLLGAAALGAAGYGWLQKRKAKKRTDMLADPNSYLLEIGKKILEAMMETGAVTSQEIAVFVTDKNTADADMTGTEGMVYISGGTEREKNLFAETAAQFLGAVREPRYLLKVQNAIREERLYYAVPELFGKKKEDAECFASHLASCTGGCDLIFTRNEAGKKALLEAGMQTALLDRDGSGKIRMVKEV